MTSPGMRKRVEVVCRLVRGGNGNSKKQIGDGGIERESMRKRENWNQWHLGGHVKQCIGNILGIMRVTLARTPNNRVYRD